MKNYIFGIIFGIISGMAVIAVVSILMSESIKKYADEAGDSYAYISESTENHLTDDAKEDIEADAAVADKNTPSDAEGYDSEAVTGYFVKEKNGYLVICYRDGTIYDYTNISVETLDTTTRKLIKEQISFSGAEELYTFLESCTS